MTAEQLQIREERGSTQQCLKICAQVVTHIDQPQPTVFENISTDPGGYRASNTKLEGHPSARLLTADIFKICKERISKTNTKLESHLEELASRLRNLALGPRSSNEQAAEEDRIKEEFDSITQCLAIRARASVQADKERVNFFEDISTTKDSHQVLVSTIRDLISANRVTAGATSRHWLGQMSDKSL